MHPVKMYTDGSCTCNPGPGGWACIVLYPDNSRTCLSGRHPAETTNNRMELYPVIKGLEEILEAPAPDIEIFSDSRYVTDGGSRYVWNWLRDGKVNPERKHADLWQKFVDFCGLSRYDVKMIRVPGHSGDNYNELADDIARCRSQGGTGKDVRELLANFKEE